ncbi:MAG: hypothetical protein ACLFS3_03280 [Candidatus Aenigmatarchaeota archaeon]
MLLLIVLSLLGGLFVWMNRTVGGLQGLVGNETEQQGEKMAKTVRIDSVSCSDDSVYVRNTGSVDLASGDVSVYVNGGLEGNNTDSINAGSTAEITATVSNGDTVTVTSPGNEDETVADC